MIVYDQNQKPVELKKELGAGGEGAVYWVSQKECAKIYAKPSPFKEAKILTMISKPPYPLTDAKCRNGRVAWPTRALYERPGGRFVGYLMPLIQLNQYQESEVVFIERLRTKTYGQHFTYEHLMTAAYNFAMTVHYIHKAGHSVGDLREKNILVDDQGRVCLVDCDSFQIIDEANRRFFASQTYTPAYLAPEWIGRDLAKVNRRDNDHFALGVWIFQMLMNGMHPYQAKGGKANQAPSLSEKIKRGTYPYGGRRGVQPPPAAPDFSQVPKSLQALFTACFVKGHRDPNARPEAMDYARVLKRELGRLKTCKVNRCHRYSGDRLACPFCQKSGKRNGQAGKRSSPRKISKRINSQRLSVTLQTNRPKPVPPVKQQTPRSRTIYRKPTPVNPIGKTPNAYSPRGSRQVLAQPVIQSISAFLLIIMLAAGTVGLLMGVASLIGGAVSGFVHEPVEFTGVEVIREEVFLKDLAERTKDAGAGNIEVISEEAFLSNLEAEPEC